MTKRYSIRRQLRERHMRRPVIAWALYDWGCSAFATSVLVGFFPLLFNTMWSVEVSGATTTARLMVANGTASLLLALSAPIVGAIADQAGWRKASLVLFAAVGATATACLFWVPAGSWLFAALVFGIASLGFAAANVFYDSMLLDVTSEEHLDRVSGFGFALGYLGGGVLLAFHLFLVTYPESFGLSGAEQAGRVVFLTVAVWWIVFAVPLLVAVRERRSGLRPPLRIVVKKGAAQLRRTITRVRQLRPVVLFLAAYWLYIDGVNTIMKVAIDFGYKLGVEPQDLMIALLVVQFIGFPATLIFAWFGERIGARNGLLVGLSIYAAVTTWAGFMSSAWEFYTLACAVGLVQGGVYSLSRSYFARLIPADESAEFFGFYNMIGKFAAVLGPLFVAGAAMVTGSTRSAVAAVLPLLVGGGIILFTLPPEKELSRHK